MKVTQLDLNRISHIHRQYVFVRMIVFSTADAQRTGNDYQRLTGGVYTYRDAIKRRIEWTVTHPECIWLRSDAVY